MVAMLLQSEIDLMVVHIMWDQLYRMHAKPRYKAELECLCHQLQFPPPAITTEHVQPLKVATMCEDYPLALIICKHNT